MENRLSKMLEMLESYPEDSFLKYAIGLEYWKANEPDKAHEYLQSLKDKQPGYLPVYYQLGKLKEEMVLVEAAIAVYDECIQVARDQNAAKTLGELQEARFIATEG